MVERPKFQRGFRVGELAQATGLTVRTLHHYEHIGLLSPRARTKTGHRVYDESDVRRLYQVCALRDMGLPLVEIRHILDDKPRLVDLLRAHSLRVEAEISRLERLRGLLRHALTHGRRLAADDLLATIEATATVSRRVDSLQQDLHRQGKAFEARWRKLGAELRACMKRGLAPASPRVLALAHKARSYIGEFAGGDDTTIAALAHLRRVAPPKNLAGWTPALMKYLDQALTELELEKEKSC